MIRSSRISLVLLLLAVLAPDASYGQALTIVGPNSGDTDQVLQFAAIAADCAPLQGQYFWQVDGGSVAGLDSNDTIQVVWDSPGIKALNVSNANCPGAVGATNITISAPGTITLGATNFVLPENGGQHQISVLRQGGSVGTAQVSYATSDGTANAGQDFAAVAGTLTWADGDASNRVVAIPIIDDTLFEDDESFFFSLSAVSGASLGGVMEAQVVILDDDPPPGDVVEFSSVLFQAEEDVGSISVTLTRSGSSAGAISVALTSTNNTATAPEDFAALNTTVNWAAGDTTNKTILVALVNDALEEGTEIADLVLSNPQAVNPFPPNPEVFLGARDLAQLVILDDDLSGGSISFSTSVISANETDGDVHITLERNGGATGAVQVNLAVTGGSATLGDDFSLGSSTVTFPDGNSQSKTVTITLVDDSEQEGLETIKVSLSIASGSAGIGIPNTVEVRIEDDDIGPPDSLRFSAALTSAPESAGPVQLSVERVGNFVGPVSVTVDLESASGTVGQDVSAAAILLQWANGEGGTRDFFVTVIDDAIPEPIEQVRLSLSNAQGAILGTPNEAALEIVDNDSGFLNFTTTSLDLSEPDGLSTLTIERTAPATQAAEADLAVTGTAELDVDFTLSTTRVEWAAGETGPRDITITVLDDQIADPGESFNLTLTNVVGSVADVDQVTVHIVDDDFQLPTPAFQTIQTLDGPRTALRPGPKNADDILQVWRETNGNLLSRFSGSNQLASLGSSSNILPGIDFDALGKLWIARVVAANSIVLSCLNLDVEPPEACGQTEISANTAPPTAVDLSISLDGTMAITWIEGGHGFLRLITSDLFPITAAMDLGVADATAIATDSMGTTAMAWLDEIAGTTGLVVYRDDGLVLGQAFPLSPATDPLAFATDIDIAFNAQGQLIVATTERVGTDDTPVQLRWFQRSLDEATASITLGEDATSVELQANQGGDLLVTFGVTSGSTDSQVVLMAKGASQGPTFTLPGQLTGLALTNHDLVQFTAIAETANSTAQSFEVYEFSTPLATGSCTGQEASPLSLCLTGERFEVTVQWQDFQGNTNNGAAVPITTDSGYHWFFSDDNVEVVLKVLNACDFTNTFWVFATGLTNTEIQLVVNDVASGITRSFFNPRGTDYAPILDIAAFSTCDEGPSSGTTLFTASHRQSTFSPVGANDRATSQVSTTQRSITQVAERGQACTVGDETLCLANNRFKVEIEFATEQGTNGHGQAGVLTGDTGTFTFFDANNIEIVVKVIDACSFNDRFWIFAGGLTDVETRLIVTDTVSGTQKTYENPLNQAFIPILDTDAFATCEP